MKNKMNINERFLHQIWHKKLFDDSSLKTLDGLPIIIYSTGIHNSDGGPDFRSAKLKIGEVDYEGDIEIHRSISDWLLHSHSGNAKYNNTILHVVLYSQASFIPTFTHSGRKVPVLILEDHLNKPLRDVWEDAINEDREERNRTIVCFDRNKDVPLETKYLWLERLGFRRLEARVKHLSDRLDRLVENDNDSDTRHEPITKFKKYHNLPNEKYRQRRFWDQLFYENVLEALGFSKNREPFLRLANILSLSYLKNRINIHEAQAIPKIQALFFGASGLLPETIDNYDEETRNYVESLYPYWDEISGDFQSNKMNKADWQFFRLRPQNFPTIRIAGLSYLIPLFLGTKIFKDVVMAMRDSEEKIEETIDKLYSKFSIEAEGYWCSHYGFATEIKKENKTLIGQNRVDDIIINAIVPLVILFARYFKEIRTEKLTMSLYHFFPKLSDNEHSRIIVSELLEDNPIITAKQQQGAIQLYKFYCLENRCAKCDVGKALKIGKKVPETVPQG